MSDLGILKSSGVTNLAIIIAKIIVDCQIVFIMITDVA